MKRIIVVLLVIFVAIQFFPIKKNVAVEKSAFAMESHYAIPEKVKQIMQTACNDCHSNNTHYPWYSKIQPVAWYLNNHIQEGKHHFNIDSFASYSLKKQAHKLDELVEQLQEGEMPLSSYTLMHKDARLTEVQKEALINWASDLKQQIISH